jgi:hypothetical protein
MISKADILKMVKDVYRQGQGGPRRRLIYPAREWGIGVFLTALCFVVVSVASGVVYLRLNSIEDTIVPVAVSTVRYQEADVQSALAAYEERGVQFEMFSPSVLPAPPAATSSATSTPPLPPPPPDEAPPFSTGDIPPPPVPPGEDGPVGLEV